MKRALKRAQHCVKRHGAGGGELRTASGFSLIELMVGMAIGMLAVIIVVQVMSVFGAQRRTTSGSANAQTNGNIALNTIVRDAQQAGYPLFPSTSSPLECTALSFGTLNSLSITPALVSNGVASGGAPASDTVTFSYGNSPLGGAPAEITALAGTVASVGTSLGCAVNDISLASSGTSCAFSRVTAVSAANVAAATITLQDNPTPVGTGGSLACLGTWSQITYAVNSATGNLDRTVTVNGASTTTPSVVGMVNLQAQYGIAASASSNQITAWVDAAVDAAGNDWANPSIALRNRIKAVRIAVVARNEQPELADVSSTCSSTTAAAASPAPETTGLCAWTGSTASPAPAIDLSPGNANWRRYRYRVFETIIPLRNVIWAKATL